MSSGAIVKTGRYRISDKVWFEIARDDRGTVVNLCDVRVDRRYWICIDEMGVANIGGVTLINGTVPAESIVAPSPAESIELIEKKRDINAALREAIRDPLRCFASSGRHKFTLQYGPHSRPRHRVFPLAGYESGSATYILYRRPRVLRGEALLKLIEPSFAVLEDASDPDRLPSEDWERFLHLNSRTSFFFNDQRWTKMSLAAVGSVVGGRVLQCVQPTSSDQIDPCHHEAEQ